MPDVSWDALFKIAVFFLFPIIVYLVHDLRALWVAHHRAKTYSLETFSTKDDHIRAIGKFEGKIDNLTTVVMDTQKEVARNGGKSEVFSQSRIALQAEFAKHLVRKKTDA